MNSSAVSSVCPSYQQNKSSRSLQSSDAPFTVPTDWLHFRTHGYITPFGLQRAVLYLMAPSEQIMTVGGGTDD